jgi:hypothetical protein
MARARAILGVALAVTGCYAPSYVDCEVTCASGSCPDGLSCRAGLCRVGTNTGACGVTGGDGGGGEGGGSDATIDSSPGVADEDADGILDGTDPCPISANNDDADSDGVGDACEPIAGGMDTLIRFEGFHGTTAPAGAQVMGNWTFSGGSAHVTSGANVASSLTFALATASNIRTTVVAKIKIDGPLIPTPADPTSAGLVSRTDGSASGIACAIGRDPVSSTDHMLLLKLATSADANFRSIASSAMINTTVVLSVTRNPSNEIFSCGVLGSVIALAPPTPTPTGNRAGIRTRSMNASFEWVMIFETR